jgi:hypothetical protein
MKLRIGSRNRRRQRGQSLAEFGLIVVPMAVMLSAILEFGLAFDANLALEAASREGARVGASLGNYGTQGVCPNALAESKVDPGIVSTVQASLQGAGVDMTTVKLWISGQDFDGSHASATNEYDWVWNGAHTAGSFVNTGGYNYFACGRHDGTFDSGKYDDIVVKIQYTYTSKTGLLSFFSGGLTMTARAVMPIGPPWKLQ